MIGKRNTGRPGTLDIFRQMRLNLLVSTVVLFLIFKIFGTGIVLGQLPIGSDVSPRTLKMMLFGLLLPGSAVGFSYLWYWLISTGRSKGLNWGAALFYGGVVALLNVPSAAFLVGLLLDCSIIALLLGLVSLLLIPSLFISMSVYGMILGGLNGYWAQEWIARSRATDSEK